MFSASNAVALVAGLVLTATQPVLAASRGLHAREYNVDTIAVDSYDHCVYDPTASGSLPFVRHAPTTRLAAPTN